MEVQWTPDAASIPMHEFRSPSSDEDEDICGDNYFSVRVKARNKQFSNAVGIMKKDRKPWDNSKSTMDQLDDVVATLFAGTPNASKVGEITSTLLIMKRTASKTKYVQAQWQAFPFGDTFFVMMPDRAIETWKEGEFQLSITRLLDLVEEKTQCSKLVIATDRLREYAGSLIHGLLYLGFEPVAPAIYQQNPRYFLMGYQI
ncbi:hypothetical protein BZG36_03139 [Bifiguratus adelaidae]|uniref:Ornithine decarboxylase antizyme n=1 Tax=Bifiguratus adelaidae TaxID=1938954 RepID=A0A261XXA9_9FUNG|nr:hypothetical protein BZG36_03139 [Bifiguratus adelaidae]